MARNTKKKKSAGTGLFTDVHLTPSQQDLYRKITDNKIIFVQGPAGTSKTFTICYAALKMLTAGDADKIIISKPVEESGERLGFLPGTVEEKIAPYFESFFSNMSEMIDPFYITTLVNEKQIQCRPLAHMRGATFHNSVMFLDEAQNCDFRQLMLFLSRMGRNSKVIIAGDISQYDIAENKVALPKFIEMISHVKGVGSHQFSKEDIVRDPILIEITDLYDKWKHEHLTTKNKLT